MSCHQLFTFIVIIFISATSAIESSTDVEATELAFRKFQLDYQKMYSTP